ncbi:10087_t:CDS:2 [Racocetra persica]|uniref:10087_t:CDS:1 n=1 Tax=Racocetra persica TaxID=160502 RepID=A0ACA9KAD7_9GLOM|nr:10087_t:CDS:2 [Racocetra persica]
MNINTILIPKKEKTFSTFDKARAFVENYAAQINIIIILRKTIKNPDDSYRQTSFVCKKQGSYNRTNEKLQELHEIELLHRTLQNDENIIANMATKPAYNDKHDQDELFVQAIF